MSGGLERVSRMKAIAAALLRFCTSTLVPGYFFSNACANGIGEVLRERGDDDELVLEPLRERRMPATQREGGGERSAAGDAEVMTILPAACLRTVAR